MKKSTIYFILFAIGVLAAGWYLDSTKSEDSAGLVNVIRNRSLSDVKFEDFGSAPEFVRIEQWLNSDPLTMEGLRGRVVLVDFWTYSCINCVRTFPYVMGWYEKYKDQGFVVIGVHTPEFAFEKDTGNVQAALRRHNINYPVAQDNDYQTWRAYNNRYWPAHYLINRQGEIVYVHFGEGKYQETEQAIQQLLGIGSEEEMDEEGQFRVIRTPEIYFGLNRLEFLAPSQKAQPTLKNYVYPKYLQLNEFALEGDWIFAEEHVMLSGNTGRIKLVFHSKDIHMVAQSSKPTVIRVFVDGNLVKILNVSVSDLYTLFEGENSGQRILELEIEGAGFEAYTFTFG